MQGYKLMHLQFSDWLSIAAFVFAVLSFATSFYFSIRDRVKIKAFSIFYAPHEMNPNWWITIKVVNHGRRIAVLTMFGGELKEGGWEATYIGEKGLGIRLAEHEFYELSLKKEQTFSVGPEYDSEYIDLWFEDSLGKRHRVKNAKQNLIKLKALLSTQSNQQRTQKKTPADPAQAPGS